jgi:hypothetical protein
VECSFEFLYKQAVTSTDAFLGMMDKDASSACCEDLDLRIDLPNAKSLSGISDSVLLLISCHEHLLDNQSYLADAVWQVCADHLVVLQSWI